MPTLGKNIVLDKYELEPSLKSKVFGFGFRMPRVSFTKSFEGAWALKFGRIGQLIES